MLLLSIVNTPLNPTHLCWAGFDRTCRQIQLHPRRLCCRRPLALIKGDSRSLSYARRSFVKDAWLRSMAARGTAFVSAPGVRAYISPAARGIAFVSAPGVRGRKGENPESPGDSGHCSFNVFPSQTSEEVKGRTDTACRSVRDQQQQIPTHTRPATCVGAACR